MNGRNEYKQQRLTTNNEMGKNQEGVDDLYEMAKYIAAAERELEVERWMYVAIERRTDVPHEREVLWVYDLPMWVYDRWRWVISWREARLICRYPRNDVTTFFSPYSKVQGENIGMQADISKLIAAKARLTKHKRLLRDYLEAHKDDIFFDEASDVQLRLAREKVAASEQSIKDAEARMRAKIEEWRRARGED